MNNQSETINELAAALAKAQGEMQAAIKDSVNPFYKSKYADLGSVWDAARPVLSKNGLAVMQSTDIVGDKLCMVTMLAHSSGQWVKSILPLNPAKNDSQGIGAAITYLRRYSLSALVGVVCDDDDDGETASGRGKSSQQPIAESIKKEVLGANKVTSTQLNVLNSLLTKLDPDSNKSFFRWIKETYNCNILEDVPQEVFDKCLLAINTKLKQINNKESKVA